MGAPVVNPDPCAEAVSAALEQKRTGNALSFLRLLHTLSCKNPAAIAEVLTGLTHFAVNLHATNSAALDLRQLVDAALAVDLAACAVPTADAESKYPALDALHIFVVNLVSADAAYVEPVLDMFARKAFMMPCEKRVPVVARAYASIAAILDAYPRAASLLADTLRARYPHPVRPVAEHCAYMRSILHVARECRNGAICRSITATVFEKLGAIEALVPAEIYALATVPLGKKEGESADDELVLTREAEKMELVLLELFRHIGLASKNKDVDFRQVHFEPMFAAYQTSIIPVEWTRFAPYVMLYAASAGGDGVMLNMVERLRHSFLDFTMSERLREKFLQHSSAMVIRSAMVPAGAALKWIASIAQWLNRYIDEHESRPSGETVDIDTDVHHLFYNAVCALMTTISRRPDAVSASAGLGRDPLDQMRLYRIMACRMNPMLVIPSHIVAEFTSVVEGVSGMDFSELLEENKGRYTPSRTKYGSRNELTYTLRCPDIELVGARSKLEGYIRSDSIEEDDIQDDDVMETETPVARKFAVGLANTTTPTNMILST